MTEKLNVGIVGLGILGRQYLEFFSTRADVAVAALCDVRATVAQELAGPMGAGAFDRVEAMVAAQPLDLVVVATPDHLHRAPTLTAINAGVPNVIQEKPLATTWEDAEAIADAAARRGTRLFVNYANRAMPLDLATYYVVQQGLIGRPVYAESRLDDNISVPRGLWGNRSRGFAAGSSPAHFLLSHVVDLMLWTFAPAKVVDVYAVTQQEVLGFTPDLYDAFLLFDSGLKVRVKAEWIKHMDGIVEYYTSISGAEGTVIHNKRPGFGAQESWRANFSGSTLDPAALHRHQQALGDAGIALRAAEHYRAATDDYQASTVALSLEHVGADGAHGLMLLGPMLDSIAQDTLTPTSWQGRGPLPIQIDGLRQAYVTDAIVASAAAGQPVALAG
jgi:predicted dehydrogenase